MRTWISWVLKLLKIFVKCNTKISYLCFVAFLSLKVPLLLIVYPHEAFTAPAKAWHNVSF